MPVDLGGVVPGPLSVGRTVGVGLVARVPDTIEDIVSFAKRDIKYWVFGTCELARPRLGLARGKSLKLCSKMLRLHAEAAGSCSKRPS